MKPSAFFHTKDNEDVLTQRLEAPMAPGSVLTERVKPALQEKGRGDRSETGVSTNSGKAGIHAAA